MSTYQDLLRSVPGRLPVLGAKDSDEDYLRRLVQYVSGIPMRQFEALPPACRDWFDSAMDALDGKLAIPLPDGYDRDAILGAVNGAPQMIRRPSGTATRAPPDGSGATYSSTRAPPAGRGARLLTDRAPPAGRGEATKVPDEPLQMKIARLVAGNENASLESIEQQLRQGGAKVKRHSVSTTAYFIRNVLRMLREIGWRP